MSMLKGFKFCNLLDVTLISNRLFCNVSFLVLGKFLTLWILSV